MLYMVLETFKDGAAPEVYRRARERGRLMPEGLRYVSSWVDLGFERCFQVMETEAPSLFDLWIAEWADLVEFEVVAVQTSAEAAQAMAAGGA
jgi:hypothetical protein